MTETEDGRTRDDDALIVFAEMRVDSESERRNGGTEAKSNERVGEESLHSALMDYMCSESMAAKKERERERESVLGIYWLAEFTKKSSVLTLELAFDPHDLLQSPLIQKSSQR